MSYLLLQTFFNQPDANSIYSVLHVDPPNLLQHFYEALRMGTLYFVPTALHVGGRPGIP